MALRLVCAWFLVSASLVQAQTAPPKDAKIHEVGKDGLRIDGKLAAVDLPLVNAPIAELKDAPHQVVHVKLQKGQQYIIELVSTAFDAFLILEDAAGKRLAHDDDSAGGLNSQIAFSASSDGVVRLLATALDRKPGGFQLTVRVGDPLEEARLKKEALKLNDEAIGLYQQGRAPEALDKMRAALAIRQKLHPVARHPDGHPEVAILLYNLGQVLLTIGEAGQALPPTEQAVAMYRKLYPASRYPAGHANLANCLSNLGSVYDAMGEYAKALPCFEESLALMRKLYPASKYPDGHANLATCLNNLGNLLQAMREFRRALPYFEQSLAMKQKLLPKVHPSVASGLNNLGFVLARMGEYRQAVPYLQQAVELERALYPPAQYPDGHRVQSNSATNLGMTLFCLGEYEAALPFVEQALALRRRHFPEAKYPDGHPALISSFSNLAVLLTAMGQAEQAAEYSEQAVRMSQCWVQREIALASEEQALAFLNSLPRVRDSFLRATRQVPGSDARAYRAVWDSKASAMRVLERRHAAARSAGASSTKKLERLRELRLSTEQILQASKFTPKQRDQYLARIGDERDQLERELAAEWPMLTLWKERERLTPEDLAHALTPGTVVVDFVYYLRMEWNPNNPGKAGETITRSCAAFIVANGRPVKRVELGDSAPIDALIADWRKAIDQRREGDIPGKLRKSLWDKIAQELPDRTTAVFLALDGDLARLPWAALPGKHPGTVLLEDHALAVIPHAPFLLEKLKYPAKYSGPDGILALGGVRYGPADKEMTYPSLPGTLVEQQQIRAATGDSALVLGGAEASAQRVVIELPKVRIAHLATHGFFDEAALSLERKRQQDHVSNWSPNDVQPTQRAGLGARSPLAYTGLVLAGANQPTADNSGVLTAERIVELPLENLRLCVLSACETGLGDFTHGEGVQGLQRAFHLAGCPNVVASLWKVNDASTAALMTKFYHEIWINKKPPIEALREAQLTIYRHPELIPDLAGERGAPSLKTAIAVKIGEPSGVSRRVTADTKLWAAFVLSGVGK